MPANKSPQSKYAQGIVTPHPEPLDLQFVGKTAKLLNHDEVVEWFEGEQELWQENC